MEPCPVIVKYTDGSSEIINNATDFRVKEGRTLVVEVNGEINVLFNYQHVRCVGTLDDVDPDYGKKALEWSRFVKMVTSRQERGDDTDVERTGV